MGWKNVNFKSLSKTIKYHLAKHGNGVSLEQYTKDALELFENFKSSAKEILLKDGTKGFKIKASDGRFGIYDEFGKIVSFGYK